MSTVTSKNLVCREILKAARKILPTLEAEVLVAHCIKVERFSMLLAQDQLLFGSKELDLLTSMIERRQKGEPISYLIGQKEFFGRTFSISNSVLIPRPDTETVVERALEFLPEEEETSVIDVCTGSGCIAVTIALERPFSRVVAVDISADALLVAQKNIQNFGLSSRVESRQGDLLEVCSHMRQVDLIIANPPYIREEDFQSLMKDVRDYEPPLALLGKGASGIGHHKLILSSAYSLLKESGIVVLEIGADQREAVARLQIPGFSLLEIFEDLAGYSRGAIFVKQPLL